MGGFVFGPHRRERIAFCGKFGGARLGCLKEGLGGSKQNTSPGKKRKNGRGEYVFGPHRRERIAFLLEIGQAWFKCSKAEPRCSKPMHFNDKGQKTLQNGMGGFVFGPHWRERIAFCGKLGAQGWGAEKKGSGAVTKTHFREKTEKMTGRMRVWTAQA